LPILQSVQFPQNFCIYFQSHARRHGGRLLTLLMATAFLCRASLAQAAGQEPGLVRGPAVEQFDLSETVPPAADLAREPSPVAISEALPSFDGVPAVAAYAEAAKQSFVDAGGFEAAEPVRKEREPVESNIVIEALASYGHYKIFASGSGCKLYTAGVEYDRHSFGRFLGARFDYVAEFLPVVLLYAPKTQDIWGTATSPEHKIVPGIGISPIGIRWLWRDKKAVRPYLMGKGGMIGFTQKALSQKATYENFSLQSAVGLNVEMNPRWDLRLGLFSDFHFSNAFIVPVNPGLDVMNANLGLSYNFRR
jgi:hypothetical protein